MKIVTSPVYLLILLALTLCSSLRPKNKQARFLIAPTDIVLSCSYPLDMEKLVKIEENYLGGLLADINLQKELIVEDRVCPNACIDDSFYYGYSGNSIHEGVVACDNYKLMFNKNAPNKKYQLNLGFWGYSSSINNTSIKVKDSRHNNIGKIERIYTLIDGNLEYTDIQIIWIIYCKDLFINRLDLCDPNDDLEWPSSFCYDNITISGSCLDKIDSTYYPISTNQNCRELKFYFKDSDIKYDSNCFSFKRSWEITDEAITKPHFSETRFRAFFSQNFTIIDTYKPNANITFENCRPDPPSINKCHNNITLYIKANDDCTNYFNLKYTYRIDIDNDSKGKYQNYDIIVGPATLDDYFKLKPIPYRDNPYAIESNNISDASGSYPNGIHKITWLIEDLCGNILDTSFYFHVQDCFPPKIETKPILINQIQIDGCITINAIDFVSKINDDCSPTDKIKIFFNGDVNLTTLKICCEDLRNSNTCYLEYKESVEVWAMDEQGNRDFSRTQLGVIDTMNICPKSFDGNINLKARHINGKNLNNIEVYHLFNIEHKVGQYYCNDKGIGSICNWHPVHFKKSSYYGVDVLDYIFCTRHILGTKTLSYFELIAADVNNTNTITNADKSSIARNIMNRTNKDLKFINSNDSTTIKAGNHFYCSDSCKIFAIMAGDLNFDALSGCGDSLKLPSKCINFTIINDELFKDQRVSIPFTLNSNKSIIGFQFDLKYDTSEYEIVNVSSNHQNLVLNYQQFVLSDGIFRIFAINMDGLVINTKPNEALFNLEIKCKVNKFAKDVIKINNQLLENVVYDNNETKYKFCLDYVNSLTEVSSSISIDIYPNPSNGQFIITGNNLNSIQNIDFIRNDGRIIQSLNNPKISSNTFQIETNLESGVYYCKINMKNNAIIKKLIVIN